MAESIFGFSTTMAHVASFRELDVYRLARGLSHKVYILSKEFPIEERYSLTDQIRRSSRSVGSQIAETWAKRKYEKHFLSKPSDADGEQYETQHWIETATDCGYISTQEAEDLLANYARIGKMLYTMMEKSSSFCQPENKKA